MEFNANDISGSMYDIAEPCASAMIESLRSFGYNVQTATADLIDNSISAGAANVWLSFCWDGTNSHISIRDDGHGMTEAELIRAMRPGSKTPCDFDWLKQSIVLGMEMGLYGKQWEDVIALTDRATGPIVMGRDRFPVRAEDNWDDAFAEIKGVQRIFPPINPVGHGLNGWQLIRQLVAKKECTSV